MTKLILMNLYYSENLSMREIAIRLQEKYTTIQDLFKIYKIPKKRRSWHRVKAKFQNVANLKPFETEIKQKYLSGVSLRNICNDLGISYNALINFFEINNIRKNGRGNPRGVPHRVKGYISFPHNN